MPPVAQDPAQVLEAILCSVFSVSLGKLFITPEIVRSAAEAVKTETLPTKKSINVGVSRLQCPVISC